MSGQVVMAREKPRSERRFAKVYDLGFERLTWLLTADHVPKGARRLWLFLAKHADHYNAVAATLATLAAALEVDERTIRRSVRVLVDAGAVEVVSLGTSRVYVLNPDEVWRNAEEHKRFASFGAKVLIGFDEEEGVRARLTHFRAKGAAS